MALDISFQSMRVLIDGHDAEGRLILADGQLTAVIVRLDNPTHDPEHKGRWHQEAGFGKCNVRDLSLFRTPEEAGAWVERVLGHIEFGEGRVVSSTHTAKAFFHEPLPRSDLVVIRDANQNRNAS